VPLDPTFVGRAFPLARPYVVGLEKLREFVTAIGVDPDRLSEFGPGAVAPPTFAVVVISAAQDALLFDPTLGLDFSRVVHRDQRFVHHRPIRVADVLFTTVHVDGIRMLAGNDVLTVRTEVTDAAGAAVCTAVGTLVARAAA